ncbi:unnamed protein product [Phaeothamnion confervicola]
MSHRFLRSSVDGGEGEPKNGKDAVAPHSLRQLRLLGGLAVANPSFCLRARIDLLALMAKFGPAKSSSGGKRGGGGSLGGSHGGGDGSDEFCSSEEKQRRGGRRREGRRKEAQAPHWRLGGAPGGAASAWQRRRRWHCRPGRLRQGDADVAACHCAAGRKHWR